MDTAANMRDLGIALEATTDNVADFWRNTYGAIAPVVQAFVTYGMLRQSDNGGRVALKNWPQGDLPMAVQWDSGVTRLCKTEIADMGTKFARYNPAKAVPGRFGDVQILRIAGIPRDVANYRKNLDSLEWQYKPANVPVYRHEGDGYVLDETAVLYMQDVCAAGERPSKGSFKELHDRLNEPFVLVKKNESSPWYVGRRRPGGR